MFQMLVELLGYARKLLPLMELYAARKPVQVARDPALHEFLNYAAEALRADRADLLELRSGVEAVQQRLRVIDDQSAALQRDLARIADQQRTIMIGVMIAAVAAAGAFITAMIAISRH